MKKKTPEEILKEMNWTYDSDPGRFTLFEQLIKPAMIAYSEQQEEPLPSKNVKIETEGLLSGDKWRIIITGIYDKDLYDTEVAVLKLFGRGKNKLK